jgi:hypothetical protein
VVFVFEIEQKLEDTGLWVKLKSDWYFEQSKSSIKLPNKERDVWKMVSFSNFKKTILKKNTQILEGSMDDLLPQLSVEVRVLVESFCRVVSVIILLWKSKLTFFTLQVAV